jgi:fluoride ion exporter CrcB/FEX
MTEVVFVALGGAVGGAVAIRWLVQSASRWVVLALISVICALMGAFVTLIPHPSGAVSLFIGPGLLATLATSISLMLPLPRLQNSSEIWQLAKRMTVSLALVTFYGLMFAMIGNILASSLFHFSA